MNCLKFEEEILKYHIGEEDEKPKASEYIKMQTHIRSCPSCSKAADQLKGVQAALNGILLQNTSATFVDNLMARLPKPSPVSVLVTDTSKKIRNIPRPVWYVLLGLAVIFGIAKLWSILFATYNLPIIYHSGDIDIRLNADTAGWKKYEGNIPLGNGDKIKTDNSATLILVISDNVSVRLSENTTLQVMYISRKGKDAYDCRLNIEEGLVWVSQKGVSNFETQQLKITTENAVIDSLGGTFDIYYSDNNRTLLRVFDGKVSFYHNHFQEEKSMINAGESSITSSDQPPTSPATFEMESLGGWEEWNLELDKNLPENLLLTRPEDVKIEAPTMWSQTRGTPPPKENETPSPTPEGYYDPLAQ